MSWTTISFRDSKTTTEFLNPTNWVENDYSFRIYADDYANEWAIVDEIDYHYLVQWRWRPHRSRVHAGTKAPKIYLARPGHTQLGNGHFDETGKWVRNRRQSTIFLHTVVMQRTGKPVPKTNQRIIVDHANGNGLDCRRSNLRYTTLSFNNRNKHGSHEKCLI